MRLTSKLLVVALTIGCADRGSTTKDDDRPVDTDVGTDTDIVVVESSKVRITPGASAAQGDEPVKIGLGGAIHFVVRVLDDDERLRLNVPSNPVPVVWTSSQPDVATVDAFGTVRALSTGTTSIQAAVQGEGIGRSVLVEVTADGQLASMDVIPERWSVAAGAARSFDLIPTSLDGLPTTLDCGTTEVTDVDSAVVSASFRADALPPSLGINGAGRGLTALSLRCDGIASSAAIVEVRPDVVVPAPPGSSSIDFGHAPSLSLKGSAIAVASHDRVTGGLVVSSFESTWTSEFLDGEGTVGRWSGIAHELDGRLLVCGWEEDDAEVRLSCWQEASGGFWSKEAVDTIDGEPSEITLRVAPDGTAWLFAADRLWESPQGARSTWREQTPDFAEDYVGFTMAVGPEGYPRLAFRSDDMVFYGAPVDRVDDALVWYHEPVLSADTDVSDVELRVAVGANHRPQVTYQKDGKLVYLAKVAGTWLSEVVTPSGAEPGFSFTVNGWGEPRLAYRTSGVLRLAYRVRRTSTWLGQALGPAAADDVSYLQTDADGRVHAAYVDADGGGVAYYVEAPSLDYTAPQAGEVDRAANTGIGGLLVDLDADQDGTPAIRDCDDNDPLRAPTLFEQTCNGRDDDCDVGTPDAVDADEDGVTVCVPDCDDNDPTRHPNQGELCDGANADNDCDATTLDNVDGDGDGQTVCGGDCDEQDDTSFIGGTEVCDLADNDCDGEVDEGFDADEDGFAACNPVECDDTDPRRNSFSRELCNAGLDDDCDASTVETVDGDGDGMTICQGDCDDGNPGVTNNPTECGGASVEDEKVLIPSGTFIQGCLAGRDFDPGGDCSERSGSRTVQLTEAFWMMRKELTVAQYEAIMGQAVTACAQVSSCLIPCEGAECPAETLLRTEAEQVAVRLSTILGLTPCDPSQNPYRCEGWRLPTDAEWEWAARAGGDYRYAGSNDIDAVAYWKENSDEGTHPGCELRPNAFGLCDMTGNVAEWLLDQWEPVLPPGSAIDPYFYSPQPPDTLIRFSLASSSRATRAEKSGTGARNGREVRTDERRSTAIGIRLVRTANP